ncbi:MAG: hypothetical protein R3C15_20935 [Thermoleophilia bacterium]
MAGTAVEAEARRLEQEAVRAYAAGDFEGAISAWEASCHVLRRAGLRGPAARAAAMTAMMLLVDSGLWAAVRAWARRATELLEGEPEQPAHALVATVLAYERFFSGDLAGARANADDAVRLGERLDVLPAVVIGRTALARLEIVEGDLARGIELLEEVAATLLTGEADPLTTGMMYCEIVCAAHGVGLLDRAAEWTSVMEAWGRDAAFGGLHGRCRVHRAELLRVSGPCDAAEQEALRACDELRPWMRRELGWPLVELGTIRLRRGDLVGAEESFLEAHGRAWPAQPGLALLRLAQGEPGEAAALIADAVEHPVDLPSKERPPVGDLRLAPLLDAQAEIAVATGDAATCRRAAERLAAIAGRYPGPALTASATLALARAALLDDDLEDAIAGAGDAAARWAELGAPFEAATARLVAAQALERAGRAARARVELAAAGRAFEEFGALGLAGRVAALLTCDAEAAAPPAPPGPAEFRAEAGLRVISFLDRRVVVRDLTGFRYVERLLAEPGRELHVLDLVGSVRGGGAPHEEGLPVLDEQARDAYRRRLEDVEEDIDEAARCNDPVRRAWAEAEREYLVAELARAVGLGGRARASGGSAERARTSVARALRYALQSLEPHHPAAVAHLQRGLRTGTFCSYEPDPSNPVAWRLTGPTA